MKKERDLMEIADKLATRIYKEYKIEQKIDCQDLLMDWIGECLWGKIIKEYIPIFNETWDLLKEGGHNKNNKFIYGDIDVGVWYENVKDKTGVKRYRKVIASQRYCSAAEDNTHIFILDQWPQDKRGLKDIMSKFRTVTVWPRQKKSPTRWGKLPSLNVYRKGSFDFGYNDCRDEGHVFKYEARDDTVDHASWASQKIPNALWTLKGHLENLR